MESRGSQAVHLLTVPGQSLGPGAMCRAVQHRGPAPGEQWELGPSARSSSQLISFLISGGGWGHIQISSQISSRNIILSPYVCPRRSSACSVRVPGLHCGSRTSWVHEKCPEQPMPHWDWDLPDLCGGAWLFTRFRGCGNAHVTGKQQPSEEKLLSEGLGGSCRAEAAGGATPGGGSCG